MIITVEPGIYISANDNQVEKKWRGIGIRIEDDVLITQKSCKVLTAKLPKRISEIEKLCA
jgi:Xaa-Pro aminopeptidase